MIAFSVKPALILQLLLFILITLEATWSLTINTYEIRDLEDNTAYLETEAAPWILTSKVGTKSSSFCSGDYILGGYQVVGSSATYSRTYSSLPGHQFIDFSIQFWVLDLVDSNDLFQIYFDSQSLGIWDSSSYYSSNNGYTQGNLCGGAANDYSNIVVNARVPHTQPSLMLKIVSLKSNSDTFSFGFRNITLLFKNSLPGSQSSLNACKFLLPHSGSSPSCLCPIGSYDTRVGNTYCGACDSSCGICLGPSTTDCDSCKTGYSFLGTSCVQCHASCSQCKGTASTDCIQCPPTSYLYQDGTCRTSCAAPFTPVTQGTSNLCNRPCDGSAWYYANKTCLSTCSSPYKQRTQDGINYCDNPCTDPLFYFPNNSTCRSSCPNPYVSSTQGTAKFCNYPCSSTALGVSYYYPNKTCLSSCTSPYKPRAQDGINYCDNPCADTWFLYPNNTCLSTCSDPLVPSTQGTAQFCNYPCSSTSSDTISYYYPDKTCKAGCSSPYKPRSQDGVNYCDNPCADTWFLYPNNTCLSSCSDPFVTTTQGTIKYCNSPCNSTAFYYDNKTCQASCDSPYKQRVEGSINYCDNPCSSLMFFYPNNTCQSACSDPLVPSTQGTAQFCNYPCSSPGSDSISYYYSDKTCKPSCSSPYQPRSQNGVNYCDNPCPGSSFLYPDNSCQTDCIHPYVPSTQGTANFCNYPCNAKLPFYYQDNTCKQACPSPYKQRSQGGIDYCDDPCTDSMFYYYNKTCQAGCPDPFVPTIQGTVSYCNSPCNSSAFYYEDKTCKASCDSPLIQNPQYGMNYCNAPCQDSLFLYWNNSCLPDCPAAFQYVENTVKTCKFSCDQNSYLYWNQTCGSSCDSPLKKTTDSYGNKFCNLPCASGEFYYRNGSCQSQCDTGVPNLEGGVLICEIYCTQGQYLYLEDGTCLPTCDLPYRSTIMDLNLKLCSLPCSPNQYYKESDGTCINNCTSPSTVTKMGKLSICVPAKENTDGSLITKIFIDQNFTALRQMAQDAVVGASYVGSVLRPNDRTSVFMIALARLLRYVTYLDVALSNEVRVSFEPHSSLPVSLSSLFSFPMPDSLKSAFTKSSLPYVFEDKINHSSYLVNQWKILSTILILICLAIIFAILDHGLKRSKHTNLVIIISKIKLILKWNFIIIILFNCFDDLTLYAILELTTLHLGSPASFASFFTCILVSVFGLWILFQTIRIARQAVPNQLKVVSESAENPEITLYKKWQAYQVLYAGYKNTSLLRQSYLFIFTCRVVILYSIVGCLYSYPLLQIAIFNAMSVLMIAYLVLARPLRSKFNLFVVLVFEILIFTVNICLLILVLAERSNYGGDGFIYSVGQAILVANSIADLASNVFMWLYVLVGITKAYKKSKSKGVHGINLWFNIISVGFQNPGMEFSRYSFSESVESEPSLQEAKVPKLAQLRRRKIQPMKNFSPSDIESGSEVENTPPKMRDVIKEHYKFVNYNIHHYELNTSQSTSKASLQRVSSTESPARLSLKHELSSGDSENDATKEILPTSPILSEHSINPPRLEAQSLLHMNVRKLYQRPRVLTVSKLGSMKAPPSIIVEEQLSSTKKDDSSPSKSAKSITFSGTKKSHVFSNQPSLLPHQIENQTEDCDQPSPLHPRKREERVKDRTLKGAYLQGNLPEFSPNSSQVLEMPSLCITNPVPEEKVYRSRLNLLNALSRRRETKASDTDSQSNLYNGVSGSTTLRDSPKEDKI